MEGCTIEAILPVTVRYGRSLGENIEAGKYTEIDHDFYCGKELFGYSQQKESAVRLVLLMPIPEDMANWKLRQVLDAMGLKFIDLATLLAIGEEHPEMQEDYNIVALETTWYYCTDDHVPVIGQDDGKRTLYLYPSGKDNETWSKKHFIGAVYKRP